ncbi:hypothetical protein SAMD00019534_002520 [Acytostelium subglobosum LB1]|uniref:hypothetical protein n=1 Tax=Acytostelium subglobosum LB1 TaxID=1410327 RepID=UPI000644A62C|nr:hypothetical protein SAMD00019534_002520 [Acytostelium subglobosum LB1]GAM17077.1 hypothetical protein SAMD00019534_002520 [Acytostelium subglobosum LB1]|eukprot:XP_012759139.1 hypothetical protein SAMD00019534_002520 [Acytostelium subglobosum LB1]
MSDIDTRSLRQCVGAIVFNEQGHILLGKRSANKKSAIGKVRYDNWQCPQGGVEEGEDRHKAVLRELNEEVGLLADYVRYVSVIADPLVYLHTDKESKNRGQSITWFFFYMPSAQIIQCRLDNEPEPEFDELAWRPFSDLTNEQLGVNFKVDMYQQLLELSSKPIDIIQEHLASMR